MSRPSKSSVTMESRLSYEEREPDYLYCPQQQAAKPVTTQIRLIKTGRQSEKMDKDMVLRRIRHRQRINKVKGAVRSIFSFPFTSNTATKATASAPNNTANDDEDDIDADNSNGKGGNKNDGKNASSADKNTRTWVDDAFAAP